MPIVFTGSVATPGCWRGLDYRDAVAGSDFHLQLCEIAYADEGRGRLRCGHDRLVHAKSTTA